MFLEEGEDPLEVIKEKTKKPAEKSADAGNKSGSVKPAEVKGKAGGAPTQPAAVKKTAVLKETQANVIKSTEQNKPREGKYNQRIFIVSGYCDLEF